jgi:hypothetical protein
MSSAGMEEAAGERRWPGMSDKAYPEVFNTIPPQPAVRKPGQLSNEEMKQFFDKGYVLVEDFFTREELDPCKDAINVLVDALAQKLYNGGKITNLYKDYGLYKRLTMLEKDFPGANVILTKLGRLPQAFRDVWSNERLLNVAEQILGTSDIIGNPVWNLRTKTPKNEQTTVPWHQDSGYLDNDSYNVLQLTAWIPLIDANESNGCMQVVQNGHKTGRIATHTCCWGNTWYIMLDEEEMKKTLEVDPSQDVITCPVPYGGALFFSNALPHRSLNNMSDDIRWSLDLRWQAADKPVGFYGLKDGVRLRSSDPNWKGVDWESFDAVDRNQKVFSDPEKKVGDFETTIFGPWMKKWELVHSNVHVEAMLRDEEEGRNKVPVVTG